LCPTLGAVAPEDLFTAHVEKAEKIATALCYRYRVSGALSYQEEAKSEARLALWRACQTFDPSRQGLEVRKAREHMASCFWNPIFGSPPPPPSEHTDPYDTFWIWAVRPIYGRIIDWFRSYHLIKRMAKDEKPSMVYHERFLSMTRAKGAVAVVDGDGQGPHDFDECLPSKDRADGYDEVEERRVTIRRLVSAAHLTESEIRTLNLAYGDEEMAKGEIAAAMGVSPSVAGSNLRTAIGKLKQAAQVKPNESRLIHAT
jgi:DNA-directed RNA polymerase specialized sigma24 family protein